MREVQPNLGMPMFSFQNPNQMALPPPPLMAPPPMPKAEQGPNPMAMLGKMDPKALMSLLGGGGMPGANPLTPGMGASLTNVPDYGMVGSMHGMLGRV